MRIRYLPKLHRSRESWFRNGGMTLIELLVVMAIITTLAAIVLPTFKQVIVERKTSVAALEVKGFLEAARIRAIARGKPVSVILERLSSRSDGFALDETNPVSVTNPLRSITASNTPGAAPDANFEQYNSCIRMIMADAGAAFDFDTATINPIAYTQAGTPVGDNTIVNQYLPGSYTASEFMDYPGVTDVLDETDRILSIGGGDSRLRELLVAGNQIEIPVDSGVMRFDITAPISVAEHPTNGSNMMIAIANEGDNAHPFGSSVDVEATSATLRVLRSFQPLNLGPTPITGFRIIPKPRPIASLINELPRGSCIDLSLSGLNDNIRAPFVSGINYRDFRRLFSSDWVYPPPLFNSLPPNPSQLRPIMITFSPNGRMTEVRCNAPGSSVLVRTESNLDVCLFVGRTGQIVPASDLSTVGTAATAISGTPNILDPSGHWIRVSAASGTISSSPAVSTPVIDELEKLRAGTGTNYNIGEVLRFSRMGLYSSEGTAQ